MSQIVNRKIVLASRPVGEPDPSNFDLVEEDVPGIEDGQVLIKNLYLSLDPYMRGRMSDAKSYSEPVAIGAVMIGATVGEVVRSKSPEIVEGETVMGFGGWQDYAVLDGAEVQKIEQAVVPISTALGVLGMPGMTAYTGMKNIGKPKPGETVVVAAASGAVGSVVGQIAQIEGARAVGIAGSEEKCRFVVDELGFDACINHKAPDFAEQLAAVCPDGIDVYFENVGGEVFQAVLPLLNDFARIPVCGLIAHYNATEAPKGPDMTAALMRQILVKRLTLRGFIVWDFAEQEKEAKEALAKWIVEGRLKYKEHVTKGLENAPGALIELLKGGNFGKAVVKISQN